MQWLSAIGADEIARMFGYSNHQEYREAISSNKPGKSGSVEAIVMESQREDVVLPDEDVVLPDEDVVLPNEDVVLANEDVVLANEDVVLANEDVVLPDEDVVLPDEDLKQDENQT